MKQNYFSLPAFRWQMRSGSLIDLLGSPPMLQEISENLGALGGLEILDVDRMLRSRLSPSGPERVDKLVQALPPEGRWVAAALLSCHPSGWVRQRALCYADAANASQLFPFLLVRTNDWVGAVRESAQRLVDRFVDRLMQERLFAMVPLLERMRRWKRSDPAELVAAIRRRLGTPNAEMARDQALLSKDFRIRRYALGLSLEADGHRLAERIDYAIDSKDARLLKDVMVHIRRLPSQTAEPLVAKFLDEEDGTIRQWAQRTTRRHNTTIHLAERYRAGVRAETRLRASLFGLGETGTRSDTPLALGHLGHKRTAVRRAALYALANLDMENSVSHFVSSLASPRGRVRRDAANWLMRFPHLIAAQRQPLEAALANSSGVVRDGIADVLQAGQTYERHWA